MPMPTKERKYHFDKIKMQISFKKIFLTPNCVLLNFFFFLDFVSNVAIVTKFEQEYYISNKFFLI